MCVALFANVDIGYQTEKENTLVLRQNTKAMTGLIGMAPR